jgi:hypothetical protein
MFDVFAVAIVYPYNYVDVQVLQVPVGQRLQYKPGYVVRISPSQEHQDFVHLPSVCTKGLSAAWVLRTKQGIARPEQPPAMLRHQLGVASSSFFREVLV